jgi:predicted nucleotidyltransferase
MTEISEKFVKEQIEELKAREEVRAIAVFGSYARDPEADHNDLDIYVIVEGSWRKRETEEFNGVVVEKFFNSMEWAESYLEDEVKWPYPPRWFSNPDIRFDPENLFEKLRRKAEEVKEEKLDEEIDEEHLTYTLWDMKQDIKTEDVAQKRFMMYKLFDFIIDKNYKLKSQIPVKDNYKIEKLQDFDGYMYKLAQDFLLESSTYKKQVKLEKMIDHLTKNMADPNPEWKTDKEKFDKD